MKIFLSVGHSVLKNGNITSANGVINEYQYCKQMTPIIADHLRQMGHEVNLVICPERQFSKSTDEKGYKIGIENAGNYDLSCEIHLNASDNASASGSEVYYRSNNGKTYAERVSANLSEVFRDRGAKKRDNLYMLNQTKAPAILVECFFCTSQEDCDKGANMDLVARKIAEGIAGSSIQPATLDTVREKLKEAVGITEGNATLDDVREELQEALGITPTVITPPAATPVVAPTKNIIAIGQEHANNFAQCGLNCDGKRGNLTREAGVRVLQRGLNLDYGADLVEDGDFGSKSNKALGKHTVRIGETQYMVTALEILLMLKGYDPNGLELPGVFGSGLDACVRQYQADNGLTVDGIAGARTFKSLIA